MYMADNHIPKSWCLVRLGDFVENEKGKKPKNQQEKRDERYCYPYVDIEAFEDNVIKSYADGINCRFCSTDDFLMVWDGSRSGLVGKGIDGALGSTLIRINFPGIHNDYAYYFLQSKYLQINSRAKGSGTPHVDPDLLWNYSFPIPPLNEQHRIVAKIEELFSELDKGVESLKKAREQLKVYRQALLKHAFEGKLTEQWRKENADKLETADQLLDRIKHEREARYQQQLEEWKAAVKQWEVNGKDGKKPAKPKKAQERSLPTEKEIAKLPELPDSFIYIFLSSLGDLGRGKSKHRPRNAPELFGGKYPFIQTGEVKAANRIVNDYEQTLSEFGLAQSKLWPKGTLCITIAANIAETAFLGFDGCFPDSVVGFTANERFVNPKYIELFIMSARTRIDAYAPATAQKNINLTTLENLVVPFTSIKQQNKVIDYLDEQFSIIHQQIKDIDENLLKCKALRQTILKKAFSGQLVPQDPNDEPASVLLERIAREKAEAVATVKKGRKVKKSQNV